MSTHDNPRYVKLDDALQVVNSLPYDTLGWAADAKRIVLLDDVLNGLRELADNPTTWRIVRNTANAR